MTTKKTPRKRTATAKDGGTAAGTARRPGGSGQAGTRAPAPTTTAADLQPGHRIYSSVKGSVPLLVEAVAAVTLGGRPRVRVRLYGLTSGLRTTVMLNADEPVRLEPVQ